MRFSKMPSIGNSCDLITADVLEAHAVDAVDSETNLIEVYLNSGADMKHNRQPGSQGE
jgi:acyl-CoA synthetase (NDP forming)